jgi:hypothetical protein
MRLDEIALVWGENQSPPNAMAKGPSVSVSLWSEVLGIPWRRWVPGSMPDLGGIKVAFVNLFHTPDSLHITEIKAKYPGIKVVGMVDPSLDLVLSHTDWMNIYTQLSRVDMIGGRTWADARVYGILLNKATTYLPSPIGPTEWFLPYRDTPTQNYIVTLDHAFAPLSTAPNVALCAALQRVTGLPVHYVSVREHTLEYISQANMKSVCYGHVPFEQMVSLTANAALCVDMYMSHSYGRQQVLCGMVGTPVLGSDWCLEAPGEHVDPTDIDKGVLKGLELLRNPYSNIEHAYRMVEKFTYRASLSRITQVIEELTGENFLPPLRDPEHRIIQASSV